MWTLVLLYLFTLQSDAFLTSCLHLRDSLNVELTHLSLEPSIQVSNEVLVMRKMMSMKCDLCVWEQEEVWRTGVGAISCMNWHIDLKQMSLNRSICLLRFVSFQMFMKTATIPLFHLKYDGSNLDCSVAMKKHLYYFMISLYWLNRPDYFLYIFSSFDNFLGKLW